MPAAALVDRSPPGPAATAALRTLEAEIDGLKVLRKAFDTGVLGAVFERAADLIVAATGRVVVTGMGKSGLVGRKIAATLASTGTPAMYIHPAEAGHGDLGMIAPDDVVIALSWSGETSELTEIVNYCRRFGIALIAVTADPGSTLARSADLALVLPRIQEACPHDLAPTTSTTLQVVMGDALAVALVEVRGFSPEDFYVFHPRGQLGARLLKVSDLMKSGEEVPRVPANATIAAATIEMSRKRLGVTAVVDDHGSLVGAFTDGDLRRSLDSADRHDLVSAYMTSNPMTIDPATLASRALALMNERSISQVFAVDQNKLVGVMHLHDAVRAGIT